MKLRNFLYLNTKIINDYLSSIEGCLYDEEDQSIATSSEKAIKAGIGIKAISCVFNFEDGKYPLVAYLDEKYFKCDQDSFIGESYMVCKIVRKIPKGKNVKLDEIFDDIKKIPMNRQQRRKMPKNMDNPDELKDVVKGPALVVVPIAVYQ